jgi:hypothetical protein
VIPPILPPIAVDFCVQLFRQQIVLDAAALDLIVGVEAAPESEQMLPPRWGGRRDGIVLAECPTLASECMSPIVLHIPHASKEIPKGVRSTFLPCDEKISENFC